MAAIPAQLRRVIPTGEHFVRGHNAGPDRSLSLIISWAVGAGKTGRLSDAAKHFQRDPGSFLGLVTVVSGDRGAWDQRGAVSVGFRGPSVYAAEVE